MLNLQDAFGILRELAHDGIAVCGALAAGAAVIVAGLAAFGVHISQLDLTTKVGAVGAVIVVASKLIDSWHDTKVAPLEPAGPASVSPALSVVPPAVLG